MQICDYGCGKQAKYKFKNGGYCCSHNHNSCSGYVNGMKNRKQTDEHKQKRINSYILTKQAYPIKIFNCSELCCYGCGNVASYQFKNGKNCCSDAHHLCPEIRRKNSENSKGKPSGMLGKTHKKEIREKWSKERKGIPRQDLRKEKAFCACGCGNKVNTAQEGRYLPYHKPKYIMTEEHIKNLTISLKNSEKAREVRSSKEYSEKMSLATSGSKNGNYKGLDRMWACYDTENSKILFCEETRRDPDNENILNVKCTYCGKWFRPTGIQVNNRTVALNGIKQGEQRLYCSQECKNLCPTYNQVKYPSDFKRQNSRTEVSSELRKIVFERDNWLCQKCESITNTQLECHHIDPISIDPMFANDHNSCITLCKDCHKEVHMKIEGCKYSELRNCLEVNMI